MKKTTITTIVCLLIVILMALAGCAKPGVDEPVTTEPATTADSQETEAPVVQEEPKTVTIALSGDVTTWNPWARNVQDAVSNHKHVFETLVAFDNTLAQVPCLATEWSTPDNGHTWDFTLREGVVFHNGNAFTAEDVVYSFNECMTEPISQFVDFTGTIEKVEAIDDLHVRFTCIGNDAILPASVALINIVDKETCDGFAPEDFENTVIGTGPYALVEYVRDDRSTFQYNENWWGEKPEADTVIIRAIPNDGTRVAALASGEVDLIAAVPVTDTPMLGSQDGLSIITIPSLNVMFYAMGQTVEDPSPDAAMPLKSPDGSNPLAKKEVRQAIIQAVDSEQILEKVFSGFGVIAPTLVPEGFNGYNPNLTGYPYDPAASEQLLDAAGYPRQADGYRFEITIDCPNDRAMDTAQVTAIASYLEKVGIKVNVNGMSRSVFYSYITINDDVYNSHFIQSGWSELSGESVLLAKDLVYGTYHGGFERENFGGANRGYYNNPEVNQLIDAAYATADWAERDALMQQVWQIVYDDCAILTTVFTGDIYGVNTSKINYAPRTDSVILGSDVTFVG